MSSSASTLARAARLYEAPVGKKAVMAISGVILFGFVLGHMLGNLQIFLPPGIDGKFPIDAYGEALRHNQPLLYGTRVVLLIAVIAHIISAIQLATLKIAARPVAYARYTPIASSYASRTMYWSGPILAAFIVYHLLHFTTGTVHPSFRDLHVHDNVIAGFSVWYVSAFYILAMVLLCLHLYHGIWSMTQSVGFSHPTYTPKIKLGAKAFAIVIAAGNISIPLSVLFGVVK
ncbi:MAG: succinate dehydrogenase cytochrome b subunit [Acidobacteria bacterium]|nr:succinate dehydrogenase cytochrome b subunit [Acidobacteriota bacterium]